MKLRRLILKGGFIFDEARDAEGKPCVRVTPPYGNPSCLWHIEFFKLIIHNAKVMAENMGAFQNIRSIVETTEPCKTVVIDHHGIALKLSSSLVISIVDNDGHQAVDMLEKFCDEIMNGVFDPLAPAARTGGWEQE